MAEDIEENGEISITDPDAKHMSASNNGTDIAHNVQIAVEELGLRENVDNAIQDEEIITVLADKGYYTGEDLEKCEELPVESTKKCMKGQIKNTLRIRSFTDKDK